MLSYKTTGMFIVLFLSVQIKTGVTIPFNFSSAFHAQELPLKKMHALCMEVWGTIDAGINDSKLSSFFQENQPLILSRIMTLQSMFDMVIIQLSKIMNDDPEHYDYILNELEHLSEVLQDAHKTYYATISQENTYTYAITHVLELIIQKITFLLHTRLAISPYYACSHKIRYPKAITPLSVPTNKLPVSPII